VVPVKSIIHHSDQGVQYTSKAYQQQLMDAGLAASMSRKGMLYDNAVVESFFNSLKQELSHHERFDTRDEARTKVFDYIEVFVTGSSHTTVSATSHRRSSKRWRSHLIIRPRSWG
jgi:putative transposase